MKIKKAKDQRAFSFIELLVITGMISVIALAGYATLSSGIKLWQKINQPLLEENVDIFFERLTHDLINSLKFKTIPLIGERESLEFASFIYSPQFPQGTLGQIIYSYDPSQEALHRSQRDFSQIFLKETDSKRLLLSGLKSLKLQYYDYNKESKGYSWKEEWGNRQEPLAVFPLAIRVELEMESENQRHAFTKTVYLPLGG